MRKLPRRGMGGVGERRGGDTRGIRASLRRLTHPRVGAGRAAHKGSGGRKAGGARGGGRRQAAVAGTKRKRGEGETGEGIGAGRGAGEGGLRRGVRRRLGDDQIEGREGAEGATDHRRGIDGRGGGEQRQRRVTGRGLSSGHHGFFNPLAGEVELGKPSKA